ncbi:alpha/beta hydrolase [Ideonella sp.]|uniref:alpha/beta hydrolase n=1 Tax=Ideonella sp. TaxID=1929293 RepID=UPI003BB54073
MTTLTTADGLSLQLRTWDAAGPPRGQVLIVHGLGEHAGRYAALASALANEGWRVSAYDQRGHGSSQGPRGVIAADDSLLSDLALVIDQVRSAGGGPLVLLGHSLGGLEVGRFVAEILQPRPAPWSRFVEGLVMSSPALDAGMSLVQRALVSVASTLVPGLPVNNGLDPDWVCSDPAVVQAYRRDPLVHDRICGRLARFIRDEGPKVLAAAPHWTLPTLLMWAGADRCVAPAGSARFAQRATDCVTGREWPGLAHEIFNEPERGQVTDVLLDWLRSQRF